MNVILFGTGIVCRSSLPYIEKKYSIKAVVDNNKLLWGTVFGTYIVEEPAKVIDGNTDIIITSKNNSSEIINQLVSMGVDKHRIYIGYRYCTKDGEDFGIFSARQNNVESTDKSLIDYDLFGREEEITEKKRILLLCSFFSTYIIQLIENISSRTSDIEFSLVTNAYEYAEHIRADSLRHIYVYETIEDIKTILQKIPVYDVIHLLWIEYEWAYFAELIRKKAKHLNIKVGGSDFYRASSVQREFKRKIIDYAERINADTKSTADAFNMYYQGSTNGKMKVLPYGVEVLEFIDVNRMFSKESIRKQFGIPADKIIITCGHNANKEHQHMKIVNAMTKLPTSIKEKIVCVFPMTYGTSDIEYEKKIHEELLNSGIPSVILKKYMNFEDMAKYAIVSDVMIHVQTTDQLSATMLEEMYAGSIVIAGSWLPYRNLRDEGIYFIDVNDLFELTDIVERVVTNISEYKALCKKNMTLVRNRASWDNLALKWSEIWHYDD